MVCRVLKRFYNATVEDRVVMVLSKPAEHTKPRASCGCRVVMQSVSVQVQEPPYLVQLV